jgi:signal transduction histidine kinase
MPGGAWEVSSDNAIILPVAQASAKDPYGFLIVGCNPYRLLDDQYGGFFSLVADQVATSFSSVHVLEEERKRAEALAEIDRAKTAFFSNISHEFRTPLTLLLGPIEDALNNPGAIEDNKVRMDVAYRNALRMQKLVNTLLEFSRIEAGRTEGRFMPTDIGHLRKTWPAHSGRPSKKPG